VRNKARLVAQCFSQVEGLDFGKIFAHVAHLDAIRILLDFVVSKEFKLYQMDVKSAFLNGVFYVEVFVKQPQVSRTPNIPIECTSLSKHRRHGMLDLRPSC
jgi:hypothetical protein